MILEGCPNSEHILYIFSKVTILLLNLNMFLRKRVNDKYYVSKIDIFLNNTIWLLLSKQFNFTIEIFIVALFKWKSI